MEEQPSIVHINISSNHSGVYFEKEVHIFKTFCSRSAKTGLQAQAHKEENEEHGWGKSRTDRRKRRSRVHAKETGCGDLWWKRYSFLRTAILQSEVKSGNIFLKCEHIWSRKVEKQEKNVNLNILKYHNAHPENSYPKKTWISKCICKIIFTG